MKHPRAYLAKILNRLTSLSGIYILNLVELKKLTLKSAKSCRTKKADSKNC